MSEWKHVSKRQTGRKLLGLDDLERTWAGWPCGHAADIRVLGPCAALTCNDCGKSMAFLLRPGHPKTFVVFASTESGRLSAVGRTTAGACSGFLRNNSAGFAQQDYPVGRDGGKRLMEALMRPDREAPTVDFAAVWRGMDCRRGPVYCELYANRLGMQCEGCGAGMVFTLDGDCFHVSGVSGEEYGTHGVVEVVKHVRDNVDVLSLPLVMADKMSDDPEQDAAGAAALVAILEKHGLVRSSKPGNLCGADGLADEVSAMNTPRDIFEECARAVAIHGGETHATEHGRPIPPVQALEVLRLVWPRMFVGVGVCVKHYDPAGYNGFCPKCGFMVGGEVTDWRRGCRECGYEGYMFGV